MSRATNIALLVGLMIPLWIFLRRDFIKGLCFAVFLAISATTFLRIEMPGGLPQLTIHRLILLITLIHWVKRRDRNLPLGQVPLIGLMAFWFLSGLLSLAFTSVDFVMSLKRYLDLIVDICLFYTLVVTSVRTPEEALRVLVAAWGGIATVAGMGVLQRYTGFNIVDYIAPGERGRDITATYQHRILLGTGMAMGFPLVFGLLSVGHRPGVPRKSLLGLSAVLILATSYFAQSRGPWLAAAMACGVMVMGGSMMLRKRLMTLAFAALVGVILRPGVIETLTDKAEQSADKNSFKGGTLMYRLELWRVAWAEVSEDPIRMLVGYGPGCGANTEIEWNLSYRNTMFSISSWDNQFAYDLYQSGLLGMTASVGLYLSVLILLYRLWRRADKSSRELMVCLLASAVAMVFMMTNVMMFVKPVNILFWTLVGVAPVLCRLSDEPEVPEEAYPEVISSTEREPEGIEIHL